MVLAGLQIHKDLTSNDYQKQNVGLLTTLGLLLTPWRPWAI